MDRFATFDFEKSGCVDAWEGNNNEMSPTFTTVECAVAALFA